MCRKERKKEENERLYVAPAEDSQPSKAPAYSDDKKPDINELKKKFQKRRS
mgnify:CR=1 FL=1